MSDTAPERRSAVGSIRTILIVSGAIALLAGIALLVWPLKTAAVVTVILAVYLLLAGVVYVCLGIFSGRRRGSARIGHIALGVLYIVAAVIAFANPAQTALALVYLVVLLIGISWIVDGVVALTLLGRDTSRVWTLLYAVLGIIAGVVVLISPLFAGLLFWAIFGVSLVVLGITQIVRAIAWRTSAPAVVAG